MGSASRSRSSLFAKSMNIVRANRSEGKRASKSQRCQTRWQNRLRDLQKVKNFLKPYRTQRSRFWFRRVRTSLQLFHIRLRYSLFASQRRNARKQRPSITIRGELSYRRCGTEVIPLSFSNSLSYFHARCLQKRSLPRVRKYRSLQRRRLSFGSDRTFALGAYQASRRSNLASTPSGWRASWNKRFRRSGTFSSCQRGKSKFRFRNWHFSAANSRRRSLACFLCLEPAAIRCICRRQAFQH